MPKLKLIHCGPHCQTRDRKVIYVQFSQRPFREVYVALKEVAFYRRGPDVGTGFQNGWHVPIDSVKQLASAIQPLWSRLAENLMRAREMMKRHPEKFPCSSSRWERKKKAATQLTVIKD